MDDRLKTIDQYYRKDLAFVHDQAYSEISVHAANVLLNRLEQNEIQSGTIVDLGCGSGKLLRDVSSHGFDTIGVDISPELIKIAGKNSPDSTFHVGSIWDYDIPDCVAVTAIGEIITYQFDNRTSDEYLFALFSQLYNKLDENGLFIFDFLTPNVLDDRETDCKIIRNDDWIMGVEYHEDKSKNILTRDITLFRKTEDGLYRQSREIHRVRTINQKYIIKMLSGIGFRVETVDNYNGFPLRDNLIAIIAQKF